jgi:genome maintenance exonuclease 1
VIPITRGYDYKPLTRNTSDDGMRFYTCPKTGVYLPSVTTILDHTSDKSFLVEWKKNVGEANAERIRDEAAALGTLLHKHMECYIEGVDRPKGNNLIRRLATRQADIIIEKGLCKVPEAFGFEVPLYYPGAYAGTTDLAGIHEKSEAIMDYKNSRKMKKKEYIDNYFCQCAAYALAHNDSFGTNIQKIVIFMVSRDMEFKEFVVEGNEFYHYCDMWLNRLDQYDATGGAKTFKPGAVITTHVVEANVSE